MVTAIFEGQVESPPSNEVVIGLGLPDPGDPYEPNDDFENAAEISIGDSISEAIINPIGDFDFFKFNGVEGQVITISAETLFFMPSLMIILYDSTGEELAIDYCDDIFFCPDPSIVEFHLPIDDTYYIMVSDFWGYGSEDYSYTLDILAAPPKPTNLQASGGDGVVVLTWASPSGEEYSSAKEPTSTTPNSLIEYKLYRSEELVGSYEQIASNIKNQFYIDNDVQNGTTYCYVVTAILDGEETDYSNEACATPKPDILYGDVSNDGNISPYDAALILQSVVNLRELNPEEFERADVTDDGSVTAFDASLVLQRSVNLIDRFPAEGGTSAPILKPPTTRGFALNLGNVSAQPGQQVTLAIQLSGENVYSGSFSLSYHNTLLKIRSFTSVRPNSKYTLLYNMDAGIVTVAFANAEPIQQGVIANVEVEVSADAEVGSTIPLDLENITINGVVSSSGIFAKPGSIQILPKHTALFHNYPNPFNPETWIPYQLAADAPVTIRIYNTKGQLIRTIALGNKSAGVYIAKDKAAYWDGRGNLGEKVASDVYYYTLEAGEFRATRKMVIVK